MLLLEMYTVKPAEGKLQRVLPLMRVCFIEGFHGTRSIPNELVHWLNTRYKPVYQQHRQEMKGGIAKEANKKLDRHEQDGDQPDGNHPIYVSAVVPMRFNLMADLNVKNARPYEQSATTIHSTTDRGRRVR